MRGAGCGLRGLWGTTCLYARGGLGAGWVGVVLQALLRLGPLEARSCAAGPGPRPGAPPCMAFALLCCPATACQDRPRVPVNAYPPLLTTLPTATPPQLKSTLAAAQQQAGRGGSSTTSAGAAATSPAISSHFSCRISPWLAAGCLSPRYMYQQMQQQLGAAAMGRLGPGSAAADGVQAPRGGAAAAAGSGSGPGPASTAATANGANWLVFELLWRDFFRWGLPADHAHAVRALPCDGVMVVAGGTGDRTLLSIKQAGHASCIA